MKVCRTCGRAQELTEFWKAVTYKDGLSPHCRTCMGAGMGRRLHGKSNVQRYKDFVVAADVLAAAWK